MKQLFDCWSRLLIDNHITDQKPEYMSRFDPARYVGAVKRAGVESAMVYACDHNGNSYCPTAAGHVHAGCRGRDLFGETVALLAREGIVPVAYYTVVYHNFAAERHPEWRVRDINGADREGRYRWCCPNHPGYREFCREQISEILGHPPVQGLFIDMTFWPRVCCCDACRREFRAAAGREIPEVVDWKDPQWVSFQRWREESMAGFARMLTAHARRLRPGVTVTHQFSPVLHGWLLGQSSGIAEASDYASGDFYGGRLQQRFGVKVFSAYSRRRPFEFMTTRCASLGDHTATKSDDELFLHAVTTLANGGAYFFIDAINPDGTLNDRFYDRLGRLGERLGPFRREAARLRPRLRARVGLYFSMAGCVDGTLDGVGLRELRRCGTNTDSRRNAVLDEMLGSAELLNKLHIPWKAVLGRADDFAGLDAVIVDNAAYLSDEECESLRRFTAAGGTLIATGKTSLYDTAGRSTGNFRLADVFGVDYSGRDTGMISYLVIGDEFLAASRGPAPLVRARGGTELPGRVALPDFPPGDPDRYASIHSDPPGPATGFAGLTEHRYGRGTCVYLFNALPAERQHSRQEFLLGLFSRHLPAFVTAASGLPPSAELTLLEAESGSELLLCIVNSQQELPNIPLTGLEFTVRLPERFVPRQVRRASDGGGHPFRFSGGELSLRLDRLENAEFFTLIP